MLIKEPKSVYKTLFTKTVKYIFIAEALGFAVSYGVWYKLNTERDFRLYMHKNCNWALEAYYLMGEKIANQKTRELDYKVWTNEGKI